MINSTPNYEEMVRKFHEKYGHYTSKNPTVNIPEEVKDLRIKLIEEEFEELRTAIFDNNLVEIADGAADLIYVIVGTMISYGIPINRIFTEVQNSNMTKTAVKAEQGEKYGTKTPKGPSYLPPDIQSIIEFPVKSTLLEIINSDDADAIK